MTRIEIEKFCQQQVVADKTWYFLNGTRVNAKFKHPKTEPILSARAIADTIYDLRHVTFDLTRIEIQNFCQQHRLADNN